MKTLSGVGLLPLVAFVVAGTAGKPTARAATAHDIYQWASPSVVAVVAGREGDDHLSLGSGSVLAREGLVLTNNHVIVVNGAPADKVWVFFKPTKLTGSVQRDLTEGVTATVLAVDEKRDLALLRVPPAAIKHAPLTLAMDRVEPGDPTIAIGHPEDGGPWTLTTGAIGNRIEDFDNVDGKTVYQMETGINHGNSGGPLLNAAGEIVGVNTAAIKVGRSGDPVAGLDFAVASDVVIRFMVHALDRTAAVAVQGPFTVFVSGSSAGACGDGACGDDRTADATTAAPSAAVGGLCLRMRRPPCLASSGGSCSVGEAAVGRLAGVNDVMLAIDNQPRPASAVAAASEPVVDAAAGAAGLTVAAARTAGKRPAIGAGYATPKRPFQVAAVDGLARQAPDRGAAAMARPAAVDTDSDLSPVDLVRAGRFQAAWRAAQAGRRVSAADQPAYTWFARAGQLAAVHNYSGARFYLSKVKGSAALESLARQWTCEMFAREGRAGEAERCRGQIAGRP
jgi:S1-C subfamily serine protease